jgi:hypothetical protein
MMRLTLVALLAATLLACSSEEGKQVGSSAVMGSALGIPAGPIGVVVGGVAGAAVGVFLPQGAFEASKNDTHD